MIKTVGPSARIPPEVHIMIPPPLMQNNAYNMNQTIINTIFPQLIPLIAAANADIVTSVIDVYRGMGGVPAPKWKTVMPKKCTLNSTYPPCRWYCDAQSCSPGQCHPNDVGCAKLAQVVYDGWLGKTLTAPPVTAPPRGWNSYDSYNWHVNETQFLSNCKVMSERLFKFGYDTCVVDFLWYQADGTGDWSLDEECRPLPQVSRWPSTNGTSFKPIADKVHAMGLKFGIHIMVGTSTFATKKNCRIPGTNSTVADVALSPCAWASDSLSVNVTMAAGRMLLHRRLHALQLRVQRVLPPGDGRPAQRVAPLRVPQVGLARVRRQPLRLRARRRHGGTRGRRRRRRRRKKGNKYELGCHLILPL